MAHAKTDEQVFNDLSDKYNVSVCEVATKEGVALEPARLRDGKLLFKGVAPSKAAKDKTEKASDGVSEVVFEVSVDEESSKPKADAEPKPNRWERK